MKCLLVKRKNHEENSNRFDSSVIRYLGIYVGRYVPTERGSMISKRKNFAPAAQQHIYQPRLN